MTVEIVIVPVDDALYRHYPRQTSPQPAFIELDLRSGQLSADIDGEIGGAVPAEVFHGFVRRWSVPPLNATAANRTLAEVAEPAARMVAGWSEEFCHGNMHGVLDDDAEAADDEIRNLLGVDQTGETSPGEDSVFAPSDMVAEWNLDGALNGEEVAEYAITGQTTDERLAEIEADILAALAECSEGSPVVCPGLLEHLEQLREDQIIRDDVVWSVVQGESPDAHAVEPGPLSITVPNDILIWARRHGLKTGSPDIYLLVTPDDEAGDITGELAYCCGELPEQHVSAIRAALDN